MTEPAKVAACDGSDDPRERCGAHHGTGLANMFGGYHCCCGGFWLRKNTCSTGAESGSPVSVKDRLDALIDWASTPEERLIVTDAVFAALDEQDKQIRWQTSNKIFAAQGPDPRFPDGWASTQDRDHAALIALGEDRGPGWSPLHEIESLRCEVSNLTKDVAAFERIAEEAIQRFAAVEPEIRAKVSAEILAAKGTDPRFPEGWASTRDRDHAAGIALNGPTHPEETR